MDMNRFKELIFDPYKLTLAFVGVLFSAMYVLTPHMLDDEWFRMPMADFISEPSAENFFRGLWNSAVSHFMEDNGRIPNLTGSAFVVLPRWIMGCVLGFAVAYCLWVGAKLAGVWRNNFVLYSLMAFLMVFALPWADFMFGIMFSLNYVVASAICLTVLYLFLDGRLKTWYWALLAGLFVSCWHEMFGGALFCGVCAAWLFDRRYRTGTTYFLIAGLLLGVLYLYLVPGRVGRVNAIEMFGGFKNPLSGVAYGVILYCLVIAILIALINKRWREQLLHGRVPIFFAMALCSWGIWRTFMVGLRTSWFMTEMSIIGIVCLAGQLIADLSINKKVEVAASVLLWLLIVGNLSACVPYFFKMKKEVEDMSALLSQTDSGPVYYDYTTTDQVPVFLLNKPNFNSYLLWVAQYRSTCRWRIQYRRVLPTALLDFSPESSEEIGDGCTAYNYKGHIVMPYQDNYWELENRLKFWYGDIPNRYGFVVEPFVGKDGEKYLSCIPCQRTRNERGKSVEKVTVEPCGE